MTKHKRHIKMLSMGLAACMLTSTALPVKMAAVKAADVNEEGSWNAIQDVVSRYYGEWNDASYPGQVSTLTPDSALMGNGDIGLNSGGDNDSKTFYISKGDFWEYGGCQKAVGGYTIGEKPAEEDASANLAYERPVQVSSAWDGTTGAILVDGDSSTQWTTSARNHNQEHWAVIDLESEKDIGYWVLKNAGASSAGMPENNTSDFKLQYSNDKEVWTDFADVKGNTENIISTALDTTIQARYVRLFITKAEQNGNMYARVGELELYEKPYSDENVAPTYKMVTSTPQDTWNLPFLGKEKAVSGDIQFSDQGYGWVSKIVKDDAPQWLAVEFENPITVKQYRIYHDGGIRSIAAECNSRDFELQYSDDGENWEIADTVEGNTDNITTRVLDNSITAKYFRVYITDPVQPSFREREPNNIRAKIGQLELYAGDGEIDSDEEDAVFYEKQDILNAEVTTDVTLEKTPLHMRTFTSANKNIAVTEITSIGNEPTQLYVNTWAKSDDVNRPARVIQNDDGTVTVMRSTYNSNKNDSKSYTSQVAMTTKVIGAETETSVDGCSGTLTFELTPEQKVYLVTAVGGGGQTYNNVGEIQGVDPAEESRELLGTVMEAQSVAELSEAHRAWWKEYWSASYIDWGVDNAELNAIQKYYYGAQYIFGCTVRENKTAPGIMGIWINTDNPKWNNHYQLNYNHNSTYYGTGSSNRPEFNKPAFDVVLDYMEQGRKNAESIADLQQLDYVYSAWVQPTGETGYTDKRVADGSISREKGIEGGLLYPAGIIPFGQSACPGLYHNQTANAAYSALAGVEYYKYTMDEAYLRDYLYEYLRGCAAFYETWLEYDETNGQYNIYAGYHEQSWGYNPAIELETIYFLFDTIVDASETLGLDADKREKWSEIRDNLAPLPTADYSGKEVIAFAEKKWNGGNTYEFDSSLVKTDGNICQLDGILLDGMIGYFSPPETLQLVRNTLDISEPAWSHGNHFTRVYASAVRSRYDINKIGTELAKTINQNMQNNLRIKDSYHGVEKCGTTVAINEMMLLSDEGITKLFPNWYTDKDARFGSLRAKGAFIVSAEYDGLVQEAKNVVITSEKGLTMTLVSPWAEGATVRDSAGSIVNTTAGTVPNWEDEKTITFDTTAGETYTVEKGETPVEPTSKTTLEKFLNKAKQHVENGDVDGLVESVKTLFDEAIAEGEAVMAKEDASKEEILSASLKLMKAIHALNMKAGDKADLGMALELAAMIDLTKYVEAGQAEYLAAKAEAERVMGDGDVMQPEVDTAWETLADTMMNLRLKADKASLADLIESVKQIELSKYTDESVKVFNDALAKANAVMGDETLSVEQQSEVDKTVKLLADAKDGLTEKKGSGGDQNGGDQNNGGSNGGNQGNGNQGNGNQGNGNQNDNKQPVKQTVKTGDTSVFFLPILGILLSFGGTLVIGAVAVRKRRR